MTGRARTGGGFAGLPAWQAWEDRPGRRWRDLRYLKGFLRRLRRRESVKYQQFLLAMHKISTIVFYIVYFGVAIWANSYAFYVIAVSSAGLIGKFLVFVLIVLFDMYVAWDFTDRRYTVMMAEIKDRILMAKFELAAADAELKNTGMFQDQEKLVELVHDHIKIAKEHLDNV
jgi:hypothetical protein